MGIIILPFILGAIIIAIVCIIKVIKLFISKQIVFKDIILGLLLSLTLFGLIALSYLIERSAWALSTYFRLPIFMMFIPFIIYISNKDSKNPKRKYISKVILVSIGLTGILGVIFNDLFFNLIDYLGIKEYH